MDVPPDRANESRVGAMEPHRHPVRLGGDVIVISRASGCPDSRSPPDNRLVDSSSSVGYDVIVLAGGGGRRLGGLDKAALQVGNRSLLDRVLDACGRADRIVVVGPRRD